MRNIMGTIAQLPEPEENAKFHLKILKHTRTGKLSTVDIVFKGLWTLLLFKLNSGGKDNS